MWIFRSQSLPASQPATLELGNMITRCSRRIAVGLTAALLLATVPVAPLCSAATTDTACEPSEPDMLGPYYEPNAPVRSSTGDELTIEVCELVARSVIRARARGYRCGVLQGTLMTGACLWRQ